MSTACAYPRCRAHLTCCLLPHPDDGATEPVCEDHFDEWHLTRGPARLAFYRKLFGRAVQDTPRAQGLTRAHQGTIGEPARAPATTPTTPVAPVGNGVDPVQAILRALDRAHRDLRTAKKEGSPRVAALELEIQGLRGELEIACEPDSKEPGLNNPAGGSN